MTMRVKCPDCGREYRLSVEAAGKRLICRKCGQKFAIGAPPRPAASVDGGVICSQASARPTRAPSVGVTAPASHRPLDWANIARSEMQAPAELNRLPRNYAGRPPTLNGATGAVTLGTPEIDVPGWVWPAIGGLFAILGIMVAIAAVAPWQYLASDDARTPRSRAVASEPDRQPPAAVAEPHRDMPQNDDARWSDDRQGAPMARRDKRHIETLAGK